MSGPGLALHELARAQWATVTEVLQPTQEVDQGLVLRLMELGFVPGERVRIVAYGLGGADTLAVRIGRTTFALRRSEAAFIRVQPDMSA